MGAIIYTMLISLTFSTVNSTILSFLIGMSLYFDTFHKHFAVLGKEIDNPSIKINDFDDSPDLIQRKKQIYIKKMLREALMFHITAKE